MMLKSMLTDEVMYSTRGSGDKSDHGVGADSTLRCGLENKRWYPANYHRGWLSHHRILLLA